jgi:hypothetical protein
MPIDIITTGYLLSHGQSQRWLSCRKVITGLKQASSLWPGLDTNMLRRLCFPVSHAIRPQSLAGPFCLLGRMK